MSEELDELAELMAEAPGGENHGRRRGASGEWRDLDPTFEDTQSAGFDYIVHVPIHGLLSTYKNDGCRCPSCRRANREYEKQRRRSAS